MNDYSDVPKYNLENIYVDDIWNLKYISINMNYG